jgi:RES domain-containing protein
VISVWRLTRRVHAAPPRNAFAGIGAQQVGGRWNRIGTRAAYASSTRSLAALEYLANADPDELPDDLVFVGASFSEDAIEHGEPPAGWDGVDVGVARDYGDAWLRSRAALTLSVPSAINKAERNFVVNPAHANARALAVDPDVEEFTFDARLLKR